MIKMLIILFLLLLISSYFRSAHFKGISGEYIVRLCIRLGFKKNEYILINDVTIPTATGTTQIDHVLVCERGIFVIETKNYSGWIFGDEKQKTWVQRFHKESFRFQNPLHQNYKHVMTLADLLNIDSANLHSLIVFTGSAVFKTSMPSNVVSLSKMVKYIKSYPLAKIASTHVDHIAQKINESRLDRSYKTNREHVKHVKEIVDQKQNKVLRLK